MKFLNIFTALSAAAMATAAPLSITKRAIFSPTSYDDLSISGGTAGGAAQAALARLGPLPDDLTTVEQSDIDFLDSVNSICNDAEKEAFNPAIEAASGDEADALQVRWRPTPNLTITLVNKRLTTVPRTARQDPEQGSQAHRYDSEAADPAGAGQGRCCRQAC
jgi:hypothetical protein